MGKSDSNVILFSRNARGIPCISVNESRSYNGSIAVHKKHSNTARPGRAQATFEV